MKANKVIFPEEYMTISRPTYTDRNGVVKKSIKIVYNDNVEYLAPLFDMGQDKIKDNERS